MCIQSRLNLQTAGGYAQQGSSSAVSGLQFLSLLNFISYSQLHVNKVAFSVSLPFPPMAGGSVVK